MYKNYLIAALVVLGFASSAWIDSADAWGTPGNWTCSRWSGDGWLGTRACQRAGFNAHYGELAVEARNLSGGNLQVQVLRCHIFAGGTTFGIEANRRRLLLGENESATVAHSVQWRPVPLSNAKTVCKYDAQTGFN